MALGLLLRIGYAAAIYEPGLLSYYPDDYQLYRMGAEVIAAGDLSFGNDLFLMRPPVYPLLVAALNLQPLLIIAVNILLGAAIIPLSYHLSRQFSQSHRLALLTSLIAALDLTSVKYSGLLVAEPLANLLLAMALVSGARASKAKEMRQTVALSLLSGAFIAASALTRPGAYLFWIPLGLWLALARRQWRVLAACALLMTGFGGYWLWTSHNAATFGHRTFSTVGNFTMLYYRAASVLHQATGNDIDEVYIELARRVEASLGNDTANLTVMKMHEHYTGSPELQAAMTAVAIGAFRDHPLEYALTIPVGLYRMLIQVGGPLLWLGIAWNTALLLAIGLAVACGRLSMSGAWRCACSSRSHAYISSRARWSFAHPASTRAVAPC